MVCLASLLSQWGRDGLQAHWKGPDKKRSLQFK